MGFAGRSLIGLECAPTQRHLPASRAGGGVVDQGVFHRCHLSGCRVEGYRGFYKGFSPAMCHVVPNVCIVFAIYEKMNDFHLRARAQPEVTQESKMAAQLCDEEEERAFLQGQFREETNGDRILRSQSPFG